MFKKFRRDRDFYKSVLVVAVPIMIQNGITNFVSLLDNLMVGQVGTLQMSGVSIINQRMFVFNLTVFGGLAGAGIFASQFFGKSDYDGVKRTIRFKMYMSIILLLVAAFVFINFDTQLIGIYLKGGKNPEDVARTLAYGKEYLKVMIVGLVPFALTQIFASTLRECGETALPMRAGITAIGVNLVFNYLLIFGKFGFPQMGIKGAAVATVMSRFVEFALVFFSAKRNTAKYPFLTNIFSPLGIDGTLTKQIIVKGFPLLANETLWSVGLSLVTRAYSTRGLEVVAAYNITTTVSNLFNAVFMAMGNAIAIIIGHELGAGKTEQAYEDDLKITWFCTALCVGIGVMIACASPIIPQFYNTSAEVKTLATRLILVNALCTPLYGFTNCAYFTLRSGGKTFITFLFDSMFVIFVTLPAAYLLTHYTSLYIVACFLIVNSLDLIKCIFGYALVKKKIWVNNIVER